MNFWTRPAWKCPGSRGMRPTSGVAAVTDRVAHMENKEAVTKVQSPKSKVPSLKERREPTGEPVAFPSPPPTGPPSPSDGERDGVRRRALFPWPTPIQAYGPVVLRPRG